MFAGIDVVSEPHWLARLDDTGNLSASPMRRMVGLDLGCMVEVSPDPDCRITLSNWRDALGTPLSRVDRRVGTCEARILCASPPARASPCHSSRRRAMPASFLDDAHPPGATRMSSAPATGVADTDCAAFSSRGLFVARSSVL